MTIVRILQYPDPRLKTKGEKVLDFGVETQKMIDDMFETHYAADNCAALACTQLDFKNPKHITVIDFSKEKNQPLCLVNAEIIEKIGDETSGEGCMSVSGGAFEKCWQPEKPRYTDNGDGWGAINTACFVVSMRARFFCAYDPHSK